MSSSSETAVLRALARTWQHLNETLFHDAMRPPALALSDNQVMVGAWRADERSLTLARSLVFEQPWTVVVEVLKHEMAHQYVHEVLRVHDESAHGPAFRRTCRRLGIDPRARGLPEASLDPERARALERVRRLLALAESDNRHEAEAAMQKAHRLMLRHNIAWSEQPLSEQPLSGQPLSGQRAGRYRFCQVGRVRTRIPGHERILAGLLARHFFVEAIWVWVWDRQAQRDARVLELCGAPENVAFAEYVHGFLLRTADRLYQAAPVTGRGSRGRFLKGVMLGFGEKLAQQSRQCEQEEGLVWLGDAGLDDYVGRRHPRLYKVRATRVVADEAFARGRRAGREIVLHKPIDQPTARRGHLLEDRS